MPKDITKKRLNTAKGERAMDEIVFWMKVLIVSGLIIYGIDCIIRQIKK